MLIYHPLFKLGLYVFLALPAMLLYHAGLGKRRFSAKQSWFILGLMLALTLTVRVIYLRNVELDVDTSTWLTTAITFDLYSDKIWTLLTYSDSRPLTVLPLIAAGRLGMPYHYSGAEMVGVLIWLGSAALIYFICALISGRTVALMVVANLCLFVATFPPCFAAYNSEHVSILMLVAGVAALVSYVYGRWNSPWMALATGLLLGSVVYAKFQNTPMGMLTGMFLLACMLRKRAWTSAALLLVGAVLPTALINMYYASMGKQDDFWNGYFWNYFYYSYTTQFSAMSMDTRFSLDRVVRFLFFPPDSGIYLISASALIGTGIVLYFKWLIVAEGRIRIVWVFSILLYVLTMYAVLQAGNDFGHYKLYLFVPLLLLLAIVFSVDSAWRKHLLALFLVGTLIQVAVNVAGMEELVQVADFNRIDGKVISSINRLSKPGEPIMVWGWRDQLHVKTFRPQGFRNVHPFHFFLKSPLIPFWTDTFLEDMEGNKPRVFIEAIKPNYSVRGEMYLPHEKVPGVSAYIRKHYRFVEEWEGIRVFVRK